jgi:Zn-dependent peptidase ImmA (M78 family)
MAAISADVDRARKAANALLNQYGITRPAEIDLEAIAFDQGIEIRQSNLKGAEAWMVRVGNRGIIRVRNDIRVLGRRNFSIGHELGHWKLHPGLSQEWVCTTGDIHGYRGSAVENEANAFSSELLMPKFLFRPYCQRFPLGFQLIDKLAQIFKTSIVATAIRAVEETKEQAVLVVSDGEVVNWCRTSDSARRYFVPRGTRLDQDTRAWLATLENTEQMTTVEANVWFSHLDDLHRLEVYEGSRHIESFGTVITLISINEY